MVAEVITVRVRVLFNDSLNKTEVVAVGIELEVLAHTVEHNHLIVDRVTDSRQHRTDEGLVYFEREGNPTPADRVHTEDEQRIEYQCKRRTY